MPGAAEDDAAVLVEVGWRHPEVEAVPATGMDQVQLGDGLDRGEQHVAHLADLGAEPAEDAADLLLLLGPVEGELGRQFGDRLGLDEDGLVAGAGSVDRTGDLAAMLLRDRQDVVMPDHREVRIPQDPSQLGRPEHPAQRLLDPLLDLVDLATDRREPAARRVEDRAAGVEAGVDRVRDSGELAEARLHPTEPGELVADPAEPAVDVADGAENLHRLGQLLGSEGGAGLGAADLGADVVKAAKRRREARGESIGHLGRQRLTALDLDRVGRRLQPARGVLAERAGRITGHQLANPVELQDLQRVRIHDPSPAKTGPDPGTTETVPLRHRSYAPGSPVFILTRGTVPDPFVAEPHQGRLPWGHWPFSPQTDGRLMPLDWLTRLDPLRRIDCPVCLRRFALFQMHLRCDKACQAAHQYTKPDPILTRALQGVHASADPSAALLSVWWTDPTADASRGLRRFLDWIVLPSSLRCAVCKQPAEARLCPHCHAHLSDTILDDAVGHIAIFGPQSVGKSTLITVLIHELAESIGPQHGFVFDPLNDETARRYEYDYRPKVYGERERSLAEAHNPAYLAHGHQATPPSAENPEILRPLVYQLTKGSGSRLRTALLSFFDCAGEDWETRNESFQGEAAYMNQARGLLFLIDPLRIEKVASEPGITLTHKELSAKPASYADDIRHLGSFYESRGQRLPSRTPLAICLNKLDRWGPLLGKDTLLRELAEGVPGASPLPANLDQLIHEEVRAALRQWVGDAFQQQLQLKFPNHRFFACSALGDAASEDEDEPLSLPTPLLVDRPILWLLRQQGVLKEERRRPDRNGRG